VPAEREQATVVALEDRLEGVLVTLGSKPGEAAVLLALENRLESGAERPSRACGLPLVFECPF
jgi:hypothetical protein